jgi:hypothetical protein
MHLFENIYKEKQAQLSVPPIPKNSLDPAIFEYTDDGHLPKLNDLIRTLIIKDIQSINDQEHEYNRTRVYDYILVGPTLKPKSFAHCPLQIVLRLNTNNLTDILKERILNQIKSLNKQIAPGTQHPIQYIPTIRPFNEDQYPSIYHPYTNKWLKREKKLN